MCSLLGFCFIIFLFYILISCNVKLFLRSENTYLSIFIVLQTVHVTGGLPHVFKVQRGLSISRYNARNRSYESQKQASKYCFITANNFRRMPVAIYIVSYIQSLYNTATDISNLSLIP
jgi:hypothetical protein